MENTYAEMYETLTADQKHAINILTQGKNVFLTGEAGTGKSYVVNTFTKYCEEQGLTLMKCAPTGIAAVNIEGATLHHQFKLDLGVLTKIPYTYEGTLDNADVILIDEISMCRIDTFENIMLQIALANKSQKRSETQKYIQIVLVGDFFQLPPVITATDRFALEQYYQGPIGKGFAFQSNVWQELGFRTINLKTIVRQNDATFCENLSKARRGDIDGVRYIEDHCSIKALDIKGSVCLTGKNSTALAVNLKGLDLLEGQLYKSLILKTGEVTPTDYPCEDEFQFKVGARVMSLLNDPDGEYFNGSIGTITSYNKNFNIITVKFDNGVTSDIGKHKFEIYRYEDAKIDKKKAIDALDEEINDLSIKKMSARTESEAHFIDAKINSLYKEIDMLKKGAKLTKNVIGEVVQFPLKLAYAITIHKSQGQTFEKVNIVPEIFDDGQFYVAVSRCKTLENIYFAKSVSLKDVKANEEVKEFYDDPEHYSYFNKRYMTVKIPKAQYNELIGKLLADQKLYHAALESVEKVQKSQNQNEKLLALKMKVRSRQ